MSVTITQETPAALFFQAGNLKFAIVEIALDSSYPANGYSIPNTQAGQFGMLSIIGMTQLGVNGPSSLIQGVWDRANNKLLALNPASSSSSSQSLIVEEAVTVAANVGRLAQVPGYILTIQVTAGGTTGVYRVIPVGTTPTTGQVAVSFLTGIMTFLSTDAVTAVLVSYVPLGVGPFTLANQVIDEAFTFTTGGSNLANRAGAIQYVWNSTDTTHLPKLVPVGEAPATHEIAIDINNSTATTITPNAAQNTNVGKVTYYKYSGGFATYGWTDQADIAVTSDAIQLATVLGISGVWIPGFGQVIIGETGAAANLQSIMEGPSGTAAANISVYNPALQKLSFAAGDAYATIEMPWLVLPSGLSPGAGQAQAGSNLSAFTLRMLVVGR